jgi:hypothetical protein
MVAAWAVSRFVVRLDLDGMTWIKPCDVPVEVAPRQG